MSQSGTRWIGLRDWALDLSFATLAGVCLGLIGPFGTFLDAPVGGRVVYWTLLFWAGTPLYGLAVRAADALSGRSRLRLLAWLAVLTAAASLPMSLITSRFAIHMWPFLRAMPTTGWILQAVATSTPLVTAYGFVSRTSRLFAPDPEADPLRPIGGRLPAALRGGLLCLQMEDHYVRVHNAQGSKLVHLSMREAIADLDPAAGQRVHRSWWVAKSAVEGVSVVGRNLRLRLVNGLEAPVSRSQVANIRAAGWLEGVESSSDRA